MGAKLSGLGQALYDPKKKQLLGRDGAAWGKLGVFYFFFYLGLAGFFCAMLAIFMALSPRDHPRYYMHESRMRTRSNPLSPGLGFRPQPDVDKNLIYVQKTASPYSRYSRADNGNAPAERENPYVKSLNQYLEVFYWKDERVPKKESDEDSGEQVVSRSRAQAGNASPKFQINSPGECQASSNYGYTAGRPCVLIKMNKIVNFIPKPGSQPEEKEAFRQACGQRNRSIAVHCYGENPADVDNIGPLTYYSESVESKKCGALNVNRFPYTGKYNRQDRYQAPYVWVQFTNPKPNVLINVLCRVYGQNIHFDKRTGRALTRFQVFVEDSSMKQTSNVAEN